MVDNFVCSFIQAEMAGYTKGSAEHLYSNWRLRVNLTVCQKQTGSSEIQTHYFLPLKRYALPNQLSRTDKSTVLFHKMLNVRIKLSGKEWEQTDKQYQGKDLRAYKRYFKKVF